MNELIKILIIEDNKFIRNGWEIVLSNEADFEIVGSYRSCESAFKNKSIENADLVHVGKLTKLKSLNIGHNDITDAGLAHLKGLKELEKLDELLEKAQSFRDNSVSEE